MNCLSVSLLLALPGFTNAFVPFQPQTQQQQRAVAQQSSIYLKVATTLLKASSEEDDEEKEENPYADPNYPDLEFVNYDDPEYQVDQGVGDEFFDPTSTEAQVEEMREERRMRNDEYQFETYYKDVLRNGEEYKGEWTIFQTSTFLGDDAPGFPKLKEVGEEPFKVYCQGDRIEVDGPEDVVFRLENERLLHKERLFQDSSLEDASPDDLRVAEMVVSQNYAPTEMMSSDFRGQQGNMCVGNGFTVAVGVPLDGPNEKDEIGPFSEYRTELGIQDDLLRFRVKLDYSVREVERKEMKLPPLHLRTMTLCREALGMWPRADSYKSKIESVTDVVFYGPAGAVGGIYDPPPVGSEEQASQYMMLDLEGGATLLVPYKIDQDSQAHPDSLGWVTTLDWAPGSIRFQVDRKINAGEEVLGLRTLELTEVQSADAETYRPRDGGADMRQ
jgi:hypothetical protein